MVNDMNEDRIVIKGITQQNIVAWMLMLLGFVLGAISFGVADHYYHDVETYINFGLGIGGWYTYGVKYDLDYKKFFFAELWNLKYGYYLVLGIIAAIVGIALIIKTGGCDITVYNDRVQGKASGSKQINVPFNRIKEARRGAFNGFTLIGTGSTDIFYCFKNRKIYKR